MIGLAENRDKLIGTRQAGGGGGSRRGFRIRRDWYHPSWIDLYLINCTYANR